MWNDIKKVDSPEGNVSKFIYTQDSAVAESVLYRYPSYEERTVICCSTQSGCPVGCRFCGAGDYFVRNLTAEEIIFQVEHSILNTGLAGSDIKKLQIMFMSMGEPLLNLENLDEAIRTLYKMYPHASLLISTIGPTLNEVKWKRLLELSIEVPTVGLQFSIHKSTDEERNKLIPFTAKLNLEQIAEYGEQWRTATGRNPFFNYCAGEDNTSEADADALYWLFDPAVWQCTISVICERNEGMPARNCRQIKLADDFSQMMLSAGYNVRVFDPSAQDDVGGGCGQLWFVQDWMHKNPDKTHKSIGNGKPTVHTPTIDMIEDKLCT